MQKVISVIVPAYNEQELIAACLDSLLNQTVNKDIYEIILVDNSSTDLTAKITMDKGVRVVREPIKGYVHAIRKGVDTSVTELIAFTDADCRVPVDWLAKILGHFSISAEIVAVGGKLHFYDVHPLLDKFVRMILYFIPALPGNNMAIRREALSQFGGIDPQVNLSLDYWLTMKLRKVGKIIVDNRLVVDTSGRRFKGSFASDLKYFMNVISISFHSKPLFFEFPDVRRGPR